MKQLELTPDEVADWASHPTTIKMLTLLKESRKSYTDEILRDQGLDGAIEIVNNYYRARGYDSGIDQLFVIMRQYGVDNHV